MNNYRLPLEYIAAFLDCDGTLVIVKRENKASNGYYGRAHFYSQNLGVLEKIALTVGGKICRSRASSVFNLALSPKQTVSRSLNAVDSRAMRTNRKNSGDTRDDRATLSRAAEGLSSAEGATTRRVSPNNNPSHEHPARKGRDSLSNADFVN